MESREVVLRLRMSRRLVAVVAVILALILGAFAVGTVFAQTTSTTINGCVTTKTGALRVLTSPTGTCKSGETAISWNKEGPQGIQGQPGTNGTNGQDGKTILNGSGAPATSLGTVGDYYIDNQANAIYGPKNADGWGSVTSLVGPAGTGGNADTLDGQDSSAFAPANHKHSTQIKPLSGSIQGLTAEQFKWKFAGPTTLVTVADGQRITGSAQAPLALDSSSNLGGLALGYDLCYRSADSSEPQPFSSGTISYAPVTTTRAPFAASATKSGLAAGTYDVGFCVAGFSALNIGVGLGNSGYVNGWVMVTDD